MDGSRRRISDTYIYGMALLRQERKLFEGPSPTIWKLSRCWKAVFSFPGWAGMDIRYIITS
jgi:hypothetical protein